MTGLRINLLTAGGLASTFDLHQLLARVGIQGEGAGN